MKKYLVVSATLIMISFILASVFYTQTPEKVASHWNEKGEVNGHMTRFWGLFLIPFVMVGLVGLFIFLPELDPLGENIKKFEKYYQGMIVAMMLFLFYMNLLVVLWNVGVSFSMNLMFLPAIGFLFYYLGVVIENSKRNWFIGIKTPWTLTNDLVWNKTHKLGGFLFKMSGIIAVLGAFFVNYALYFILIPLLLTVIITIVYSYFEFKKENK